MANGNGNGATKLSNNHPSANEPTLEELKSVLDDFFKDKGMAYENAEQALASEHRDVFLKTARSMWFGKRNKERKAREEQDRRELSQGMETITRHVNSRIEELTKQISAIAINPELKVTWNEPTPPEVRSELEKIVKTLNLKIGVDQIRRIDIHALTRKMLHKQNELSASEKARDASIVLNAMREKIVAEGLVIDVTPEKPADNVAVKLPLWRMPLVSTPHPMVEENPDLIPAWVLADLENARNYTAALRGHLIRYRKFLIEFEIPRLKKSKDGKDQKLLKELDVLQMRIQKEMIDKVTAIFRELFNNDDPEERENFCPSPLYFSLEEKFDEFFREKLSYVVANYKTSSPKKQAVQTVEKAPESTPPKDAEALEKRKQLVTVTMKKLIDAGFTESDAGPVAARIIKRFDGDIPLAAVAQCSMLEQQGLSEDDKKSIEEKIAKFAKAADISVEEVKARYEKRKAEMKDAQERQNEQKYLKLKAHDAVPVSANKARRQAEERRKLADKKAQDKKEKKNGRKNSGK